MRILLAVSGGIDSMYLAEKAPELFPGASFAVAHCNFRLRGDESDGDEAFVRQWCSDAGLDCFVRRFDTRAEAETKNISIEMAARDLRYEWFAALCRGEEPSADGKTGFDAVALAHNADDNAETLILNLVRGTGIKGMRGMSADVLDGRGVRILRPLLAVPREDIHRWMVSNGKTWREDSSNAGGEYKRNRIRHEVLPVLKELNPALLKTLTDDMAHFAQVDDIADDCYALLLEGVACPEWSSPSGLTPPTAKPAVPPLSGRGWHVPSGHATPSEQHLSISNIIRLVPRLHQRFFLWKMLSPYGFDSGTVESLADLLEKSSADSGITLSGKTFEAAGWKAVTSASQIHIVPKDSCGDGADRQPKTEVFDRPHNFGLKVPEGLLIADADKLPLPLKIRAWQPGDWMVPLGMKGRKKLSDLFVDLKWDLLKKENAKVIEHPDGLEGHVAALLYCRIDDSLKITASTRRIIRISRNG